MEIDFDPAKNGRNIAQRGLSFERLANIDWVSALMVEDRRREYGEQRFRIFGLLDERLHVAVVTKRDDAIRVISFRKANRKEELMYERQEAQRQDPESRTH